MKFTTILSVSALASMSFATTAQRLSNGTEVDLAFRQSLSSKTAKAGDHVRFTVAKNVTDSRGHIILRSGTPVMGVIERVDKRDHFGKNARIRIALNPVHGINLQPRDKGSVVGGTRSDMAGATSGGAALIFGPLGLVGGYFVVGHTVHVHPGSILRTEVTSG